MTGGKFYKKTVRDVPVEGKTVLLRADYNVPLESDGTIADDFRIKSSLPTVEYLLKQGCKVVIISHLGRPDGQKNDKFTLEPVADRLAELLGRTVYFVEDCIGDKVKMAVKKAPRGSVLLLENLRFYAGEEANDAAFAKQLAKSSSAQYFVQDGFGVVHRAHASTAAITMELPSVAGLLLEKEYMSITNAMQNPKRPLVAVLGGAKVSDKLPLLKALIPRADRMLVGGAMANTFLAAGGLAMGKSKIESGQETEIKSIYKDAIAKVGTEHLASFLQLPSDLAVGKSVDETAGRTVVGIKEVGADDFALDIGDQTIERYVKALDEAGTVIWNGTMGMAEFPEFAHGSARIALALAEHPDTTSVIGGGDTADFVLHWDSKKGASFTHVSTGGGASLELMSGEKLPGIEALLPA